MARILIVEDDLMFRSVLAIALNDAGHNIVEACDGRAALEVLRSEQVDLILADVLMPESDGIQLIMDLCEAGNTTPIIAMTGGHEHTDLYLKVAQSLGARRVLIKPFRTPELLERIRETLAN
jgi:DNA-binding response OmpR family regulator